jgi:hypothetical protein
MRIDRIIVVGMLSDETYKKRQKHCRRVLSPAGMSVCIPAGCGTGGGVTPKVIEVYDD